MTAIAFERAESEGAASRLLFERGSKKHKHSSNADEEKAISVRNAPIPSKGHGEAVSGLAKQSVFTFKDIDYFVHYHGSQKQLLDKVSGFVKPGQLVALMGTSGAGKTTYDLYKVFSVA